MSPKMYLHFVQGGKWQVMIAVAHVFYKTFVQVNANKDGIKLRNYSDKMQCRMFGAEMVSLELGNTSRL